MMDWFLVQSRGWWWWLVGVLWGWRRGVGSDGRSHIVIWSYEIVRGRGGVNSGRRGRGVGGHKLLMSMMTLNVMLMLRRWRSICGD